MITMTDIAYNKAYQLLVERNTSIGLRVGVKTTGCSGLAYILEFANTINDNDEVFKIKDVKIVIDDKSLVYINCIELDYQRKGLNEGFEFINPNVKATCGCGKSFTV